MDIHLPLWLIRSIIASVILIIIALIAAKMKDNKSAPIIALLGVLVWCGLYWLVSLAV
jgi:hypothetical protein